MEISAGRNSFLLLSLAMNKVYTSHISVDGTNPDLKGD